MSIKLENIAKSFSKPQQKLKVLENINLEIKDKDMLVIFGRSGAGKTTLLNLIGGMDQPTSGKVIVDGQDLSTLKPEQLAKFRKDKIGFVFQAFNLLGNLKAQDNIILPVMLDKDAQAKIAKINAFAVEMNMQERLGHRPGELSLGEQQRVAILRAMINRPAIILADEPTAHLDGENSAKVIAIFKRLNREYGTTIILVTDHEGVAENFQQRFTLKS